jgi:hypothetical protein
MAVKWMFYELARAAVQRVFQDKILMGLVIVMFLAILVGGFGGSGSERTASERTAPTGPRESNTPSAAQAGPSQPMEPVLATDFIKWWLNGAMDFNATTAAKSHSEALAWMTADAVQPFQANFWPPEMAEGIASGRVVASFTPTSVQAVAANPDGSIVVTVAGQLTMQTGPQPATHQFYADFLVRKDQDGLRVAGVYNRMLAAAAPRPY